MPATHAKRSRRAPRADSAATTHVSSIMSREVVTVRKGTSVESVIELMLARGLSRLPVIDENGHLIGIVSKTDLVEHAHDAAGTNEEGPAPREKRLEDLRGFHVQPDDVSLEEVMSRSIVAVGENATVQRAAELMVGSQIHGLPVVTASGELVGFVSTMDVLAWLSGLR